MPDLTLWTSREILRMKRDLDSLFTNLCQDFGTCGMPGSLLGPRIDLVHKDDVLLISAELPGVNPEHLQVSVQDDKLILAIEHRQVVGPEGGPQVESHSRFSRTIRLPCQVDADKAEAVYEKETETLTITLHRCEPSSPKPLRIRIG